MVDEGATPRSWRIRELAAAARVPVTTVSGAGWRPRPGAAPQGVLALAALLPEASLDDLETLGPGRPAPFLVALDGVTDPGNLGAILRSAECAGHRGDPAPHRAVHVTRPPPRRPPGRSSTSRWRSSAGCRRRWPTCGVRASTSSGSTGAAPTTLYDMAGGDGPLCLVLGAEGWGALPVGPGAVRRGGVHPAGGRLGSLNVSAAAALTSRSPAAAPAVS